MSAWYEQGSGPCVGGRRGVSLEENSVPVHVETSVKLGNAVVGVMAGRLLLRW